MINELAEFYPAVKLPFWVNTSKKENSATPSTAALDQHSGMRRQTSSDSLSQLSFTLEPPVKRARTDSASTMINPCVNDEANLNSLQLTDKKPAAKLNPDNPQQLNKQLMSKGLNLDCRNELFFIAEICPELFRNVIDRIPSQVNSYALKRVTRILQDHPSNDVARSFIEEFFAPMIQLWGSGTQFLVSRDEWIADTITGKPVNSSLLAMLKDSRFRDLIFPDRVFGKHDFAKLMLVSDLISTGSAVHYEWLASHASLIKEKKFTAEYLQYVMAVAANRITRSEDPGLSELVKMKPLELAQKLIMATAPDAYQCANEIANTVMKAAKKSKDVMGARILAFLAENPALIDKFDHAMHRAETKVQGEDILSLLDYGQTRIRFYSAYLQDPTCPILSSMVSKRVLLSLSLKNLVEILELVPAWKNGSIDNFYASKGDKTIVHLLAEVIRRKVADGACVASTVEERKYVSMVSAVNKALYNELVYKDGSPLTLHFKDLSTTNLEKLINLHSDLCKPRNSHSEERLDDLLHQGQTLQQLLQSQYELNTIVEAVTKKDYPLMKQHHLFELLSYPELFRFACDHLRDLSTFSGDTLRELVDIFRFTKHSNRQAKEFAAAEIARLEDDWDAFKKFDVIKKQRLLHEVIEGIEQIINRVEVYIHNERVISMVETTLNGLLTAFSNAGWPIQSRAGAGGNVVIEPIKPEALEEELLKFKSYLQRDLVNKAKTLKGGTITDLEAATRIHEKAYQKVLTLAANNEKQIPTLAKQKELEGLTALTKPHGALKYLFSKHLESDPKTIGSRHDKITMKQLLGVALFSAKLSHEHVKWHEGLDTPEKRNEAIYEGLTTALHDSHIAYLGTVNQDSHSCWDGGANRIMMAVRTLIDFEVMPSPVDFAAQFLGSITNTLESLAKPEFVNDNSASAISIKQKLNQQMMSEGPEGNNRTLSLELFKIIEDLCIGDLRRVYPQTNASDENQRLFHNLLQQNAQHVEYIDLPESFVAAVDAYPGSSLR